MHNNNMYIYSYRAVTIKTRFYLYFPNINTITLHTGYVKIMNSKYKRR